MKIKGKVWKFGQDIDTDAIIPARYLNTSDPEDLSQHCMEDTDPDFAKKIKRGDIIVAGKNFGCGSSREHARSEEHTSELQSHSFISYAVFCLKKKKRSE